MCMIVYAYDVYACVLLCMILNMVVYDCVWLWINLWFCKILYNCVSCWHYCVNVFHYFCKICVRLYMIVYDCWRLRLILYDLHMTLHHCVWLCIIIRLCMIVYALLMNCLWLCMIVDVVCMMFVWLCIMCICVCIILQDCCIIVCMAVDCVLFVNDIVCVCDCICMMLYDCVWFGMIVYGLYINCVCVVKGLWLCLSMVCVWICIKL